MGVAAGELVEIEARNPVGEEAEVVGAGLARVPDAVGAEGGDRCEQRVPEPRELRAALERLPADSASAVVEHQDRLNAVGVGGMRRGVGARAEQPLLLATEQDEADGALRRE